MHHPTARITHNTCLCYTSRGALAATVKRPTHIFALQGVHVFLHRLALVFVEVSLHVLLMQGDDLLLLGIVILFIRLVQSLESLQTHTVQKRSFNTGVGNYFFHGAHEREREFFYLTTHSTHFIYGYMVSDIWLRTILIVRKETRCRHIGYSYRLTARVLLYAPSHRQDNTYHGLCYTSYEK